MFLLLDPNNPNVRSSRVWFCYSSCPYKRIERKELIFLIVENDKQGFCNNALIGEKYRYRVALYYRLWKIILNIIVGSRNLWRSFPLYWFCCFSLQYPDGHGLCVSLERVKGFQTWHHYTLRWVYSSKWESLRAQLLFALLRNQSAVESTIVFCRNTTTLFSF